ncbi:Cytochrome p450 [Thalictrum thalictroides]|uniref:Cytochrome p450 n=1 Tax=Thalictrum thalictroides TaxID=46969 RepID=A0A7J6WHD6_THATH|nr:Cytochrome p450 [Thalictrum thalictroides]
MWSVPVNLPFTRYNRSIRASSMIQSMFKDIIGEKRLALEKGHASPDQDLITSLLNIHGNGKKTMLSESEIVDNVMPVTTTGYDTSSVLITFMVQLMASDPIVYAVVLRGKSITFLFVFSFLIMQIAS